MLQQRLLMYVESLICYLEELITRTSILISCPAITVSGRKWKIPIFTLPAFRTKEAYKSLGGYNIFIQGWMKNSVFNLSTVSVLFASVKHDFFVLFSLGNELDLALFPVSPPDNAQKAGRSLGDLSKCFS